METIDALIGALKAFQGAAIVVSHDAHFVAEVTSELWVVGGGRCQRFSGTFEDYRLECTAAKRQQTASRS
jgi:ATPase subunit of ABC transporter with duplicated ATPase domains